MPDYYEAQERAMAPGIVKDWPDVILHPKDKNGRLVKMKGVVASAYVWILYLETGDYDDYMKTVEGVFATREAAERAGAAYPCRGRKKHPVTWLYDVDDDEEIWGVSCNAQGHEGLLIGKYPLRGQDD